MLDGGKHTFVVHAAKIEQTKGLDWTKKVKLDCGAERPLHVPKKTLRKIGEAVNT